MVCRARATSNGAVGKRDGGHRTEKYGELSERGEEGEDVTERGRDIDVDESAAGSPENDSRNKRRRVSVLSDDINEARGNSVCALVGITTSQANNSGGRSVGITTGATTNQSDTDNRVILFLN